MPYLRLCWTAIVLLSVSCSKFASTDGVSIPENGPGSEANLIPVELAVAGESATKMTINGATPEFLTSDLISLFGKTGVNSKLGVASATGSKAPSTGEAEAEGPWIAAYPYSEDNSISNSSVILTVPTSQVIPTGGCVGAGALVCTGYTSDLKQGVTLKNVVSLLRITLAIDQADMNSITIRSNDGTPLAGKVKVNPKTGEIEQIIDGVDHVTVTIENVTFTGAHFYIAVLPGSHEGMTVSFTRVSDARKAEVSSPNKLTSSRSQMVDIGGFDDYSLVWEYLIDSYDDLMAYAADSKNWVVGEDVELRTDIDMQSKPWTPLTFTEGGGVFKGNGHKIYNLIVSPASSQQHAGFFGKYYKSIDNLIFGSKDGKEWDGVSTITCNYTASTSAYAYAAPITFPKKNVTKVTNFCKVVIPKTCGSRSRAGGICAFIEEDGITIKDCVNYGKVETFTTTAGSTQTCVGGIAGGLAHNSDILIENCTNYGEVISHNKYTYGLGGILGEKYSDGSNTSIKNCTNYGNVSQISDGATQNSRISIGGIVGQFAMDAAKTNCVVSDCKNYGNVFSSAICAQPHIGGICGRLVGGSILNCVNEGNVDMDFELAVSFTAMGGIVGYLYKDYGDNYVVSCINRGKVTGNTYSIGFANKTDGLFHGTVAGGIIGVCEIAKEISGNENYGEVEFVTNRKGTSTYDAVAYAGGILAFGDGPIESFTSNHNYPTAKISATAKNASSSSYEEICAGGVVGKFRTATMYVGINEAPVSAQKAAKGKAWAGSIAGVNESQIATCYYAGTVNGATADKTNVVGSGNAPQVAGPVQEVYDYDESIDDLGSEDVVWD